MLCLNTACTHGHNFNGFKTTGALGETVDVCV